MRRRCASLVMAEQVLDAGAGDREPQTKLRGSRRREGQAFEKDGTAFGKEARCRQCPGPCQQELDPLLGGRALGHETKCGGEPARGALGRLMHRRVAGFAKNRHRGLVS